MAQAIETMDAPGGATRLALWPAAGWRLLLHAPLLLALAGLVFVLPYAAGYGDYRLTLARWLAIQWAQPTWQHGALAPLIAGFLVWRRRAELRGLAARPSLAGLPLAVLALVIFWVGYRGNFYFIGYTSLQVLVAAAVLWIWGWEHFKRVSFAWFILGFAWPYLFLEDTVAFRLRYLMVGATSTLLNLCGVATLRDGTSLISAAVAGRAQGDWFTLGIDGPCSGMRSLFALLMVSALYAHFRQRSIWRRGLVFLCGIPLAVLANMVRILVLVGGSIVFGQEFAVGRGEEYTSNFHLVAGVAVFVIATGGLRLVESILNRLCGRESPLPPLVR